MIGGSVTLLGAGHQDGPIDVPGDRCQTSRPAGVVFPDEPQRRSAAGWVMRHRPKLRCRADRSYTYEDRGLASIANIRSLPASKAGAIVRANGRATTVPGQGR